MGAIADCICKNRKKKEQKASQEGKTTDETNSPNQIKQLNNTTLNENSPNILLPNTYEKGQGIISLESSDRQNLIKINRNEESKEKDKYNLDEKYIPQNENVHDDIFVNIVIEEEQKLELSLKLKEFNEVFDELRTLFKGDSFTPEIVDDMANLEYLALIRFLHENPSFQETMEESLKNLEVGLSRELLSKVLYNPSLKGENVEAMKSDIINQYLDKADKVLNVKLPNSLIEPFKLNIRRIIDRKIKKEIIGLKEWESKQEIKEEYAKKNINITFSISTQPLALRGTEQKEEELIESTIWGKPDYSEEWGNACTILLEKILENKLEPFDFRLYKNINYEEFMKTILNIIQNSKRTFIPQVYQDFQEVNFNFIKSLSSSLDKEKLLNECKLYLQDVENKIQRKNAILRALSLFKMFEVNFTITQKLFTLFSIFLCLSGTYEGKPFNSYLEVITDFSKVVKSDKNGVSQAFENFKNAPYKPIGREITRKVLKYLLRRSEPNSTLYSFRKLLSFEKSLGVFFKMHDIRIINETFISKEFLLNEGTSIDLKEMMKQINSKYEHNETYLKLLNLLLPNKDMNSSESLLQLIESERVFKIERINNESSSRNLILCISGYMSEKDDEKVGWAKIVKFFPDSQIMNIRWASTTLLEFFGYIAAYTTIVPIIIYIVYRLFKKKEPNSFQKLSQNFWKNVGLNNEQQEKLKNIKDEKSIKSELENLYPPNSFDDAKKNAELAGALLAFLIALRVPSDVESISILCFSMGSEVLGECLCYLKHFSSFNRIHDVIFFGGSRKLELNNGRNIQSFQVVNGKVFNSFSKKDWALWFLSKIGDSIPPIGTYSFQVLNPKKSETSIFYPGRTIRNYENKLGHLDFRDNFDSVLSQLYQRYLINI